MEAISLACENALPVILSMVGEISAAALASAAGVYAWGAVVPSSQLFGQTTRRMSDPKALALTFDDGPNPRITPSLLHLLERYDAHATFFLIGRHVRAFPSLAKEIASRGHAVGNHTETHPHLTFLSPTRVAAELESCREAILAATGLQPRWMRPPFGFRGPQVGRAVRNSGCAGMAMWSALAWDWKVQPAAKVIKRLGRVAGGDILLLHDGDHRMLEGDRRHTVAALEHWLPRWKDAGLRLVTIDG